MATVAQAIKAVKSLNLWKLGGQPTSFSPLPAGGANQFINNVTLGRGDYTVSFRASSLSSAYLWLQGAGGADYNYKFALTPVETVYSFDFSFSSPKLFQVIDQYNTGDVIIKDLVVTRRALPALPSLRNLTRSKRIGSLTSEAQYTTEKILSLNKVSLNGNPLTKQGTVTVKANFDGKTQGVTDLIPHTSKVEYSGNLAAPSAITAESSSASYALMVKQDGTSVSPTTTGANAIAKQLLSFDLIRLMTDKFGTEFFSDCPDTPTKVTKLKNLLTRVQADWWGYGTTVLSNYAGTTDFASKVAGSVTENANKAFAGNSASLTTPTTAFSELVTGSAWNGYDRIITQNSDGVAWSTATSGMQSQALFSFNLIEYVKRKYGFTPDVAWLKANVTKLTANWWGFGSTVLSNPTGTTDFAGKVAGSTVENANIFKQIGAGQTSLPAPSAFTTELGQTYVDKIKTQDGTVHQDVENGSGVYAANLFSFNLIEYVQRKYSITIPGADTASKVAWLKANVASFTYKWYGYGSSPAGNKATASVWTPAGQWNALGSHSLSSTNLVSYTESNPGFRIDANGFVHILAYADPSNGVTASTINTDYVSLDVTMAAGSNKATLAGFSNSSWWTFNTNTANTPTKMTALLSSVTPLNSYIQSDGFVHFLAYADPSNGLAPSVINTDYISLDVEVDAGSNKATFARWEGNWVQNSSLNTHTNGTVSNLRGVVTNNTSFIIQSDGFAHFLAYADPSNGVKPSTINTDYIELTVDVNMAETGYDTWVDADSTRQLPKLSDDPLWAQVGDNIIPPFSDSRWSPHAYVQVTDEETFTINADAGSQGNGIDIPVLPNTTYTFSVSVPNGSSVARASLYLAPDTVNWRTVSDNQVFNYTFTTNATDRYIRVRLQSGATGAYTFTRPMLTVGSQFQPYKRGRKINRKRKLDFLGKVAGSVDSVPHRFLYKASSTFDAPTNGFTPYDNSLQYAQTEYNYIMKQGEAGGVKLYTVATAGLYALNLFEFDLSHLGLSLADLQAAIRSMTYTWVGWGRGDNAGVQTNGATIQVWDGRAGSLKWSDSGYEAYATNTSSAPSAVTKSISSTNPSAFITTDQKVYILVHSTYPASATYASEIYTDYVKLDIVLADYVDYVRSNGVKIKQADPSKVKLFGATTRDVVDIEYVRNDPKVYPKKNLLPTDPSFWMNNPSNPTTEIKLVSNIMIPANTQFTLKCDPAYKVGFNEYDGAGANALWTSQVTQRTFTTAASTYYLNAYIKRVDGGTVIPADVTKAQVQLEAGSTATAFEPYMLIGGFKNANPSRKVPKKNLYQELGQGTTRGAISSVSYANGKYIVTNGASMSDSTWGLTLFSSNSAGIKVRKGDVITVSAKGEFERISVAERDSIGNWIVSQTVPSKAFTYTVTSDTVSVLQVYFNHSAPNQVYTVYDIQVEKGSVATAYESYQLIIPPARPGLRMNGLTDYLQFPSMTMDAIEVDCLIDSSQPKAGYHNIIDVRNVISQGYVSFLDAGSISGGGTNWASVTGAVKDIRTTVRAVSKSVFTTNAVIFGFSDGTKEFTKGTIYAVRFYLAGQLIKEYDFTKPTTVAGGKALPKVKSILPGFDNDKWSFHSNFKVFGKGFGRLDATASTQDSTITLQVQPNTNYLLKGDVGTGGYFGGALDGTNTSWLPVGTGSTQAFKTGSAQTSVTLTLRSLAAGSFEFKNLELYQLDGAEPTFGGLPAPKVKAPRRILTPIR